MMAWWPFSLGREAGGTAALGRRGERLAARHLKRQGYRILGRNLRSRLGEIDLAALAPDGRTLVIVEVKAGRGRGPRPEVHVNGRKQRKLVALAVDLVRRHGLTDRPVRFDIVAVDWPHGQPPTVRHHIGAFQSHV